MRYYFSDDEGHIFQSRQLVKPIKFRLTYLLRMLAVVLMSIYALGGAARAIFAAFRVRALATVWATATARVAVALAAWL